MGHSVMKFPDGLDANDRLSWVIGVATRNETFLYLQSCALLARLKTETRKFEESRRAHGQVLKDCRKLIRGHPYVERDVEDDALDAITRAQDAVKLRNDLTHKIWTHHDVDTDEPSFSNWFSSFDETPPVRHSLDDFANVSTLITRASLSLGALEWMIVSAHAREIPGFGGKSEVADREAPFLLRGEFEMLEGGGWIVNVT